jgi:serine/threonine protein kinase
MTSPAERLAAALADRYRIERPLGQGGMATVYLAEDIKHDRKVAIKVLKPELAAVLGAERFVQEIKTTAALSHPHILPLFDSGEADGFLYYVMPFIAGETIRDRLNRETQLGVDEAVRITCEIADALDYAHRHGVIHRDIKPENLLLHDGRAMVMDFGIALAVSAAAGGRMTETGLSLGTPHYMSPEQATAEREITARSDIYSLGSVLYEMLAGEPPHIGNSAQAIIMKIVTEDASPVTRLRKTVPANVTAAVAKSLERLAADRFETAKAFGDALKDANFATRTMPAASVAGTPSRWRGALVGGLALGAVAGAVAMFLLRPNSAARGEISRDQLTFSGIASQPAVSPDGKRIAYVAGACTPADIDCAVSLEVLEIGGTKAQVLVPEALALDYPRWSHDGETIVIRATLERGRSGIFAIPRLNATPRLLYEGFGAYDTHPSADSVVVISFANDSMSTISMADGAVASTVPVTLNAVSDLAWSPSGDQIAVSDATGLHVLDRTGTEVGALAIASRRPWLRWSTAGDALIYFRTGRAREDELVRREVSDDGAIAKDAELIMPRTPTLYNGQFDVARKTGALVILTGDATTDLWSIALDRKPLVGTQESRGTTWYGTPVISNDDQYLYYMRGDAIGDNLYRLDLRSREEEALTAEAGPAVNRVTMSADGKRLVYGRAVNSVLLMQQMDVQSRRVTVAPMTRDNRAIAVPPRGFIALSERGALTHLDSMGAAPRALTNPDSVSVVSFTIAPDGVTALFVGVQRGAGDATASVFVGGVSIRGGAIARLSTIGEPQGPVPELSATLDGRVFISRWLAGDARPSLWQMPLSGGSLVRVAEMPAACATVSLVVGWSGKTATCVVDQYRGDVWIVDLGRATR